MRPGLKAAEDRPADLCRRFLDTLQRHAPAFHKTVSETAARDEALFREAAEPVLSAAAAHLGDGWAETLVTGYTHFVIDVNKSQRIYEREGRYRNKTYQEVFDAVYGAADFMDRYHWGVLVTMFAWWHHLRIYGFYRDHFLPLAAGRSPRILDLGAGSGVWHILALQRLGDATVTAVDISTRSIALARETAEKGGLGMGSLEAGFFLSLLTGVGILSTPVLGHLSDKFGRKQILVPGFFAAAVLSMLVGTAGEHSR